MLVVLAATHSIRIARYSICIIASRIKPILATEAEKAQRRHVRKTCPLNVKDAAHGPFQFRCCMYNTEYAAKEMERFEQKCKQLLVDSRPGAGGDETTIEFQLPVQLLSLFGQITIFLLCDYWRFSILGRLSLSVAAGLAIGEL